ncbi:MAG: efflux transporter periplasmic adaptor subunit, partial [Cyanobacteria bacterium J06628_3]
MASPIEIPVIGKVKKLPRWLVAALFAAGVLVVGATTTYVIVNRANNEQDITELTVSVEEKNVTLLLNASGKVVP